MTEPVTIEETISIDNLIYYYEARVSALSEYSTRVWNDFNWFLTLHLAILGFFFTQFDKLSLQPFLATGVSVIGIVVAALWALMGAEDYSSLKKHHEKAKEVEKRVNQSLHFHFENDRPESPPHFRQTWLLFVFPLLVLLLWIGIFAWA